MRAFGKAHAIAGASSAKHNANTTAICRAALIYS
jgi:hypothetical protein